MSLRTLSHASLIVVAALIATTAGAQTSTTGVDTAKRVRPWSTERVREFVVKQYPTILVGDTIGHVNILLDPDGEVVRTTAGKMDSVHVFLGSPGPVTAGATGMRFKSGSSGQVTVEQTSGPLNTVSYGLDDIDPTTLGAAFVYGYRPGDVGPRRFVATVLVLKRPKGERGDR